MRVSAGIQGCALVVYFLFSTAGGAFADSTMARAAASILSHQDADGAITMGYPPNPRGRVIPYFANIAAQGLVAAYRDTNKASYLRGARRWADWYAAHQNPDGTEYDYVGGAGKWHSTETYDSTDSYAATYLELVRDLVSAAPDLTWQNAKKSSIQQAVEAIKLTLQPVGLTLAKPDYPVMYTMDNTETARGLRAAAFLFHVMDDRDREKEATTLASAMEKAINEKLWDEEAKCYLIGFQKDGGRLTGLKNWYPDLMANLMTIGWFPPSKRNKSLYQRLITEFKSLSPTQLKSTDHLDHLIWWAWAANGAGDKVEFKRLRQLLLEADKKLLINYDPAVPGHVCRLLAISN